MKTLIKGAVAVGLLLTVASCSSDSKSTSTTKSVDTTVSSGNTTAVSTAASTDLNTAVTTAVSTDLGTAAGAATTIAGGTPSSVPVPSIDTTGLSAAQAQALTVTVTGAAAQGVVIDSACLSKVIAKMSDADAQLIVTAGVGGNPTLSEAGEALSPEAQKCLPASSATPAG